MSEITEDKVLEALQAVIEPNTSKNIVELGLVSGLIIKGGNVGFAMDTGDSDPTAMEPVRQAAEEAVRAIPGVLSATVMVSAERAPSGQGGIGGGGGNGAEHDHSHGHSHDNDQPPGHEKVPEKQAVEGVKSVVAVASGKGGVGKSTVAANLAIALKQSGLKVGLLDADVYGPSVPRMLGGRNLKPEANADGTKLIPLEAHGISLMSMGFLIGEDKPMIWRGPMVSGAIQQLFREVLWDVDVLVVDMPPGTGDAQLTLAQSIPVDGAVIVSTPQDIALIDARKGLEMFKKVDVPIFGIVENMAGFQCPHCGESTDIFGHGGAKAIAAELETDFLGEIPLDLAIRETSDSGTPIVEAAPISEQAKAFKAVAEKVAAKL